MPKRIISDSSWKSKKVRDIQPLEFRPEYAWLMPLFDDNGVAEYDPDFIWAAAYALSRNEKDNFSVAKVTQILDELIRVGLYYKWHDERGRANRTGC